MYYVMPESCEFGMKASSVHTGITENTSRTVKDRETTDNFPGSMNCSRGIVHTLTFCLFSLGRLRGAKNRSAGNSFLGTAVPKHKTRKRRKKDMHA